MGSQCESLVRCHFRPSVQHAEATSLRQCFHLHEVGLQEDTGNLWHSVYQAVCLVETACPRARCRHLSSAIPPCGLWRQAQLKSPTVEVSAIFLTAYNFAHKAECSPRQDFQRDCRHTRSLRPYPQSDDMGFPQSSRFFKLSLCAALPLL